MANTQIEVKVADIPAIIDDPQHGVISLVGDHGGISLITGPSNASGLVMGTLSIETEHGVIYLDPDEMTTISEEDGTTVCDRHGGSWGEDLTCKDCTTEDGKPRPLPDKH